MAFVDYLVFLSVPREYCLRPVLSPLDKFILRIISQEKISPARRYPFLQEGIGPGLLEIERRGGIWPLERPFGRGRHPGMDKYGLRRRRTSDFTVFIEIILR